MIANIERSANLFVTKTVYAVLLAITVVDRRAGRTRTCRATSPSSARSRSASPASSSRWRRTRGATSPASSRGCCGSASRPASSPARPRSSPYGIARYGHDLPTREVRTTSALVLIAVALWVLVLQARPFNWWKTLLVASMVGAVALILVVPALPRLLRGAAPAGRGARGGGDRGRASPSSCSRSGGASAA